MDDLVDPAIPYGLYLPERTLSPVIDLIGADDQTRHQPHEHKQLTGLWIIFSEQMSGGNEALRG